MVKEQVSPDVLTAGSAELLDTVIARTSGQYREGQRTMVRLVAEAIEGRRHLLVQAGTGTGKSLAYLIPVCEYVKANRQDPNRKPVLIATATLALQAQIMERDIPKVLNTIAEDPPLRAKLFKGRANYICKYKVSGGYGAEEEPTESLPVEERGEPTAAGGEVKRLYDWARTTKTGDRDDFKPGVSNQVWRQASVTSQECLNRKCPMLQECFSERAREEAAAADIIVTNHALLALDIFEDGKILPEYGVAVIDEAHELQERVTSSVTEELSARMVYSAAQSLRKHADADVEPMIKAGDGLNEMLGRLRSGLLPQGLDEYQLSSVSQVFNACKAAYADTREAAATSGSEGAINAARVRVARIRDVAERIAAFHESEDVLWVQRSDAGRPYRSNEEEDLSSPAAITIAPLSVAPVLWEGLFGEHTIILTSATLAVGGSFSPLAANLGLASPEEYEVHDVGSPFDYAKQGILYAAKHLGKPGQGINAEQLRELHALITASGGGALGLFSSHRAAQEAAEYLRRHGAFDILLQGESTLAGLIEEFTADRNACLFGTISLWQGVDVPGLSCRLVVIDRIPFPRPDDPLVQAKTRAAEKAGANGFMSVPATYAATKLAQGAGRLIRSAEDRGVVAVLDSRLATARYGGFLKKGLPPLWATTDPQLVYRALERLGQEAQPAGDS